MKVQNKTRKSNFFKKLFIKFCRYFDYEIVGKLENSNLAHDRGFFVGNQPFDIRDKIDRLRSVINKLVV